MIRVLLETADGQVACGTPLTHISEGWVAAVDTNREDALSFVEDLDKAFAGKPRSITSIPVTITVAKDGQQHCIEGAVDGIYFTSRKENETVVAAMFRVRLEDGSRTDVTLKFGNDTFTARHGTNRSLSL